MPPFSWFRLLDVALGLVDMRRARRAAAAGGDDDRRREEAEAARRDAERREAERAARVAAIRQAVDREIGRLRLIAGLALAGWVGSLFVAFRVAGGGAGPYVLLATGWVLLLVAMTSALVAQANLATALARVTNPELTPPDAGIAGIAAIGLLVGGLALIAIAALAI
jgi:hypothetical protein